MQPSPPTSPSLPNHPPTTHPTPADRSGNWVVGAPTHPIPGQLPEPCLGINFARDGMGRKDWLALVALHCDAWLMSVAFFYAIRLDAAGRALLFKRLNLQPTLFEVATGRAEASAGPLVGAPVGGEPEGLAGGSRRRRRRERQQQQQHGQGPGPGRHQEVQRQPQLQQPQQQDQQPAQEAAVDPQQQQNQQQPDHHQQQQQQERLEGISTKRRALGSPSSSSGGGGNQPPAAGEAALVETPAAATPALKAAAAAAAHTLPLLPVIPDLPASAGGARAHDPQGRLLLEEDVGALAQLQGRFGEVRDWRVVWGIVFARALQQLLSTDPFTTS